MNWGQIKAFVEDAAAFSKQHSPQILFATGTIGVGVTTVLGIRAGIKMARIHERYEEAGVDEIEEIKGGNAWEVVKTYAPAVLPPVIAGVATAASFGMAQHVQVKRVETATSMAVSAMALAAKYQNIFEDIKTKPKNKQAEEVSKLKEEQMEEAAEEILKIDPNMIEGQGDAIFYDCVTGKCFWSSEGRLEAARAAVLRKIADSYDGQANLADFYMALGVDDGWDLAGYFGWDSECPLDITYTARYDHNVEKPIGVISYKYKLLSPYLIY